jgi:UDP-N-acetylmuramoyl-tripeptide--D-alanyl-D-alanine ligase
VPLTILKIKADAQMAIIEMGANHQKEIESYCQYAMPNYAIINNCGKAHLEGFGGVEGVRKGKGELYDYIKQHGGTIFRNADYDYLQSMSQGITNIIDYGTKAAFTSGSIITAEPFLSMQIMTQTHALNLNSHLVGDYNAANILAAICVGHYFNITPGNIKQAIENYLPTNSRSQLIEKNNYKIILDAYNANPSSMQVAINNFDAMQAPYKIAMLGAMKEMGSEEQAEHQNLIHILEQKKIDKVLLTGEEFLNTTHNFSYATNSQEAKAWLQAQQIPDNTLILVKGSRGIAMEKAIDF